jgi:hypothetical protein
MPESECFDGSMRLEVLGAIVEETTNTASTAAILVDYNRQSIELFDCIDAVRLDLLLILREPELEVSRTLILAIGAELEVHSPVAGCDRVVRPKSSTCSSRHRRCQDDSIAE